MTREMDLLEVYDFLLNHAVDEPVTIVKNGQPQAALVPYEFFLAIKKQYAPKAMMTHELSADDLDAILNAEIPEEHAQFDHEVDGK